MSRSARRRAAAVAGSVLAAGAALGCHGELVAGECPPGRDVYTPYRATFGNPTGSVGELPWRGDDGDYPDGVEDFRGYLEALPLTLECSADKAPRSHLDVTAGCLEAVADEAGGAIGRVAPAGGYFRAIALGHTPDAAQPVQWTDQSVEYRFRGGAVDDDGVDGAGFKAFVRYRSEDDLYVASWRYDGVVQIQEKRCGVYEVLARLEDQAPPAPDVWHTLRFTAVDEALALRLDGEEVLSARRGTYPWGTAGIRIDASDVVEIDDWRIAEP